MTRRLHVAPNATAVALDRALRSIGVEPRPPLDADQCELARGEHRTVCRVLYVMPRGVCVDMCGVRINVPRDGSARRDGWRLARYS